MRREQFTFYRSYYEAMKCLPKREQTAVLMAVVGYALDQEEPDLSGVAHSIFSLIRPTLDSGRNKACNRLAKTKSNEEQIENKPATKARQKRKEKEGEKEGEVEREGERENDSSISIPISPPVSPPAVKKLELETGFGTELQTALDDWIAYKAERRERYTPVGKKSLITQVAKNAQSFGEAALAELIQQSMASGWKGIPFDRLGKSLPPKQVFDYGTGKPRVISQEERRECEKREQAEFKKNTERMRRLLDRENQKI